MANRSGVKGDEFERFVAKTLNGIYDTKQFKKTPGSGALVGLSNFGKNVGLDEQVLKTLGSDIIVPDWFPFSVECKWYKDKPNYATILKKNDSDLDIWLGEALYDSINLELIPMLFFKTNNKGVHVAIPRVVFDSINLLDIYSPDFGSTPAPTLANYLIYGDFVIFGLEHLTFIAEDMKVNAELYLRLTKQWINESTHVAHLLDNMKSMKRRKRVSR